MRIIDFGFWVPRFGIKSMATRMFFMGIEFISLGNDVFDIKRWFGIRVWYSLLVRVNRESKTHGLMWVRAMWLVIVLVVTLDSWFSCFICLVLV